MSFLIATHYARVGAISDICATVRTLPHNPFLHIDLFVEKTFSILDHFCRESETHILASAADCRNEMRPFTLIYLMHVDIAVICAIEAVCHVCQTVTELDVWGVWCLADSCIVVLSSTFTTCTTLIVGQSIYDFCSCMCNSFWWSLSDR